MYTPIVSFKGGLRDLLICLLSIWCASAANPQDINLAEVNAREEFHWGVKAFHESLYGESIRAFERALSFTPDDKLIQEWLGRSYYRSGFESTAVSIWESILEADGGSAVLRSLVDTVKIRRGLTEELADEQRYVTAAALSGERQDVTFFSRPAGIFAKPDGSYYVTSFAGNQVVLFSANNAIMQRYLGGLQGLDHPFDVLETNNGFLYISEFLGNRIFRSGAGDSIRFGEKGTGDGKLIGPQFLADDLRGYIYVTESGNRRVSKFDYDGNFILSFGMRSERFGGLRSPAGILVHREAVYVADNFQKIIFVFDLSGNYRFSFGADILQGPEGISLFDEQRLLIADTSRVLVYDIEMETFGVLSNFGGGGARITKAVRGVNGDILVADFTKNTVTALTEISNLYSGLSVEIARVQSRDFPSVFLEISVEDRAGAPYLGLDRSNFIITEQRGPTRSEEFLLSREGEQPSVALLVERSVEMDGARSSLREAAETLYQEVADADGRLSLISAGAIPIKEASTGNSLQQFGIFAADAGEYSDDWKFSLGLRLAAAEVMSWPGIRAVVFVTSGSIGEHGFDDFELDVLTNFMVNNDVSFYCIYVQPMTIRSDELEYLCEETGGMSAFLYQPKGIKPIFDELMKKKAGRYFFSYESASDTEFGMKYLSVEAEVFHFKRTGRDETGYFAPRE